MGPGRISLKPEIISLRPEIISLKPEIIALKPEIISLKPGIIDSYTIVVVLETPSQKLFVIIICPQRATRFHENCAPVHTGT